MEVIVGVFWRSLITDKSCVLYNLYDYAPFFFLSSFYIHFFEKSKTSIDLPYFSNSGDV